MDISVSTLYISGNVKSTKYTGSDPDIKCRVVADTWKNSKGRVLKRKEMYVPFGARVSLANGTIIMPTNSGRPEFDGMTQAEIDALESFEEAEAEAEAESGEDESGEDESGEDESGEDESGEDESGEDAS
jgi:hypothetical protein